MIQVLPNPSEGITNYLELPNNDWSHCKFFSFFFF